MRLGAGESVGLRGGCVGHAVHHRTATAREEWRWVSRPAAVARRPGGGRCRCRRASVITRKPTNSQLSVAITWSIGAPSSVGSDGRPTADRRAARDARGVAASAESAARVGGGVESRVVVEGRVQVAGQDDVVSRAAGGEPLEALPPARHLAGHRERPDAHRRSPGRCRRPAPRAPTAACRFRRGSSSSAYSPRSSLISTTVERAFRTVVVREGDHLHVDTVGAEHVLHLARVVGARLGQHHDVGILIERSSWARVSTGGESPRVFQESTVRSPGFLGRERRVARAARRQHRQLDAAEDQQQQRHSAGEPSQVRSRSGR